MQPTNHSHVFREGSFLALSRLNRNMKKAALIFLVLVYAFSTTGISLRGFYCCGKLESVKFTLAEYGKGNGDCCKTTYQSYKIRDEHIVAEAISTPVLNYALINSFNSCRYTPAFFSKQVVGTVNHAPPLFYGVPAYISDCVYRI